MERVMILVDKDDLMLSLKSRGKEFDDDLLPISIWEKFNGTLLRLVKNRISDDEKLSVKELLKHMGTWMFVSKRVDLHAEGDAADMAYETRYLEHMKKVDSLYGFIIKYGISFKEGSELYIKGIDVNLVCQMLVGAFEDEYDICVLVTDDDEFIPAVEIVQNFYGKQVFHAGFEADRLRAACFGNIPFESEWDTHF